LGELKFVFGTTTLQWYIKIHMKIILAGSYYTSSSSHSMNFDPFNYVVHVIKHKLYDVFWTFLPPRDTLMTPPAPPEMHRHIQGLSHFFLD